MSEPSRESINRMIEFLPKHNMGKGLRELWKGLIEIIAEFQVSDVAWEG